MWERMKGWGRTVLQKTRELALAAVVGVGLAIAEASPALAQTTSIFPVSADVATVKSDLLLWATALIGVALAVYAFRRVRGLVNR